MTFFLTQKHLIELSWYVTNALVLERDQGNDSGETLCTETIVAFKFAIYDPTWKSLLQ